MLKRNVKQYSIKIENEEILKEINDIAEEYSNIQNHLLARVIL